MNINSFDFNLLRVFNALMNERNVTRAAEKIGLAQSSMSNALSRLRYAFDDELFVRTPKGMLPTERALSLQPHVDAVFEQINTMINVVKPFQPESANGTLSIATSDNIKVLLAPALSQYLQSSAPLLNVRFTNLDKSRVFEDIDNGDTDLAIGTFADTPKRFNQQVFYQDTFVCIARKAHPKLTKGMTLRRFAEIPHVLVSLNKDNKGVVDTLLEKKGMKRRVAITVDQFTVLPHVVESTDYLAICPASIAEKICKGSDCKIYDFPLQQSRWKVNLVWGAAAQTDNVLTWLRKSLLSLADSDLSALGNRFSG